MSVKLNRRWRVSLPEDSPNYVGVDNGTSGNTLGMVTSGNAEGTVATIGEALGTVANEEEFDYSLAEGVKPNRENMNETSNSLYGGQYMANRGSNGDAYAAQYLQANGASPDITSTSPVYNSENEVVKTMKSMNVPSEDDGGTEEKVSDNESVQFLANEGLLEKRFSERMQNAPEYVSEEEQARRLRAARSAQMVSDLGSIASAFANLYYTGQGAYSQTVGYAKAPQYQTMVDRWENGRKAYRAYRQNAKDYVVKQMQDDIDRKYTAVKRDLDMEYRRAQIEYEGAKTTAQLEAASLKKQQALDKQANADRNYQLALDRLEETKRKNKVTEGQAQQRIGIAQANQAIAKQREERLASSATTTSTGDNPKGQKPYKGGNYNYNIPSNVDQTRMENKIIEDMIARGVIDDNNYTIDPLTNQPMVNEKGEKRINSSKPKKSRDELVKEMHKNWDKRAGDIVRQDYMGSKRGESTATPSTTSTQSAGQKAASNKAQGATAQTPKKVTNSNTGTKNTASSNSSVKASGSSVKKNANDGTASGGTGTWGSSINRKKKS